MAKKLEPIATELPPDYVQHDATYRRLRARGAPGWDADDTGYAEMLSRVAPLLPVLVESAPQQLLELGCGAGNFSVLLAQRGYAVTGVDIAPSAVDWAIERAGALGVAAQFRVDNVLTLATCADAAMDVVVDGHCLHCIIGGDRARCLAAVLRVLQPGGVFIVLTMCGEVRNPRMLETFDPVTRTTVHAGRPTRYIGDAASIVAEVAAVGFEVRTMQVISRKDDDDLDDLVVLAVKPEACAG